MVAVADPKFQFGRSFTHGGQKNYATNLTKPRTKVDLGQSSSGIKKRDFGQSSSSRVLCTRCKHEVDHNRHRRQTEQRIFHPRSENYGPRNERPVFQRLGPNSHRNHRSYDHGHGGQNVPTLQVTFTRGQQTRVVSHKVEKPKTFKPPVMEVGRWYHSRPQTYYPLTRTQKRRLQRQHAAARRMAEKENNHEFEMKQPVKILTRPKGKEVDQEPQRGESSRQITKRKVQEPEKVTETTINKNAQPKVGLFAKKRQSMVWVRKPSPEAIPCIENLDEDLMEEDMEVQASAGALKVKFGSFGEVTCNMVVVLPMTFGARPNQVNIMEDDVIDNGAVKAEIVEVCEVAEVEADNSLPQKIVFEKPAEGVSQHLKPLYINAHFDGMPVNRVLVDNGAAINILPVSMLSKIYKTQHDLIPTDLTVSNFQGGISKAKGVIPIEITVGSKSLISAFFVVEANSSYKALLGRDWIHACLCVPSSLHQALWFWNGDKVEMVQADNRPFWVNTNAVEAWFYEDDVGLIRFLDDKEQGRPTGVTAWKDALEFRKIANEIENELARPVAAQVSKLNQKLIQ